LFIGVGCSLVSVRETVEATISAAHLLGMADSRLSTVPSWLPVGLVT
jgi:hypothetical protein